MFLAYMNYLELDCFYLQSEVEYVCEVLNLHFLLWIKNAVQVYEAYWV